MAALGDIAPAAGTARRWIVANRAALLAFMDLVEQCAAWPPELRDVEQAWHRAMRTGLMKAVDRGCVLRLVYRPSFSRFVFRCIRADPQGILTKNPIPRRQPSLHVARRTTRV